MLKTRSASEHDCRRLWRWVNDPDVRRWSFDSDPIEWDAHVAWFREKRADPNCWLYVIVDETDEPFGLVRLDVGAEASAEVAVSIARDRRGRGYGAEALRLACARFFADSRARQVVAHIKPDNEPSIRAFEATGFTRQGTTQVKGQEALCMILAREAEPG